jgi:hypothetical protein
MATQTEPAARRDRENRPVATRRAVVAVLAVAAVFVAGVLLGRVSDDDPTVTTGRQGSGVAATQSRDVPPFTGVELSGTNVVLVRVGAPQSVVVRGDDNLVDRVTTTVRSGTLVIGSRGSFATDRPMRVEVRVPSLTAATLSGSGTVTVEGVDGEAFTALLPGSGVISVDGNAGRLEATLSGSGDMRLQDLVARDVVARIEGSGRLWVHAVESLDAAVSGSGAIRYGGNPARVTQDVTGSGAVTPE